jgi:hypothetical protein
MGYKVLNISPEFRASYGERRGLEGPFFYGPEAVLYYDPKEGKYLNPRSDLYLTFDEYQAMTECHGV